MSNKVVMGVLGVIVLVSMGVGVLIGMQLGDEGGANPIGGAADSGSAGTPTPIPTATPGQSSDGSGQSTDRTTVAPRRFDDGEIRAEVGRLVNERRAEEGLDPLRTDGQTAARLERMGTAHSVAMADAGRVSHDVNGTDSEGRYRNAGLYGTCQFESAAGTYIIDASDNRLETLSWTVAGREYEDLGRTKFNGNETAVARDIVRKWYRRAEFKERLSYENAQRLGVGIEITQDGTVYATGNLC